MLTERYSTQSLQNAFIPRSKWRPFPPASDREAWNGLSADPDTRERIESLIKAADSCLDELWPGLPATLYMQFAREGDRLGYETPYFERRARLGTLALAECLTGQGKYLAAIANALWSIMEETTWCIPAHADRLENDPLPHLQRESVDLFACETAATIAEIGYLLRSELQSLSSTLVERMENEALRRVIVPVETRDDFHWLAGRGGRFNNWTPWCSANVLNAAMYILDDNERLAALAGKLMTAVDKFIGVYGEDGGCDEGPRYWGVAAGALLLFLEHLHSRTDGKESIYDESKIRAMGEYITSVQLSGPWFVNFADASARVLPVPAIVYRYGERIGSDDMQALAIDALHGFPSSNDTEAKPSRSRRHHIMSQLRDFWWLPPGAKPEEYFKKTVTWLPDIQVLIAREDERQGKGLVLAAKGGHNRESHNHNDVGQFIIMLDGHPRLIDVGVESYSRKTFSPERYDIWCIRGNGHNVPVINGYEQAAGLEHRATNVEFSDDGVQSKLAMNLEDIFPGNAGVKRLHRELLLDRSGSRIRVTDNLESHKKPVTASITLYACPPVDLISNDTLAVGPGPKRLILQAVPRIDMRVETVPIEDRNLRSSWGDELARITLDYLFEDGIGEYTMNFTVSGD